MGHRLMTFWTYCLFPAVLTLLPWPLGFRILKHVAKKEAAPQEEVAWENAVDLGFANENESAQWIEHFRLVPLVDRLDGWLLSMRGDDWLDRWVDVNGAWPQQGPFLAVTYHWGAGLWSLRHLKKQGHSVQTVLRRVSKEEVLGAPGLRLNLLKRNHAIESAQKNPIIWTGGSSSKIREALGSGIGVIVICDVLLRPGWEGVEGRSGDYALTVPRHFLEIAQDVGVPVVPFSMWLNHENGRRNLEIGEGVVFGDVREAAAHLASFFVRLLRRNSAAWGFWPLAKSLLRMPSMANHENAPSEAKKSPERDKREQT